MKQLSLVVMCMILGISNIWGQDDPFFVSGYPTIVVWPLDLSHAYEQAFWHTNYHTCEGAIYNLTYKILGDSIVNEKKYGKMYFYYETREDLLTGMGLDSWGQPYGKTEFTDTLLYRQDGDKVFCLPKGEKEEVLIVDYGLQVGEEFVDGSGEKFRVTETKFLKEKYDREWTTIGSCYIRPLFFYWQPKVVELVSLNTGERDTWVEGLGSINWGVVPMYIAQSLEPFRSDNQLPRYAKVCAAFPENMIVMPNINEEDYKAMLISDWEFAQETENIWLDYSFEGDTLCVSGVQDLKSQFGISYAECLIADNRIVFMLKQTRSYTPKKKKFCVHVPSFKAGVYEIAMPGEECVTLECQGTPTQIENVKNNIKTVNTIYDLQGRKMVSGVRKGITIKNGKKTLHR